MENFSGNAPPKLATTAGTSLCRNTTSPWYCRTATEKLRARGRAAYSVAHERTLASRAPADGLAE